MARQCCKRNLSGTYGVGSVDEVAKDQHNEQSGSNCWSFTLLAANKIRSDELR